MMPHTLLGLFAPLLYALVGGYLLGSVPFGLLLTRMAGLGDVRAIGSGNIGATNVLRTGRKDIAFLTLLLDGGKGTAAALLATAMGEPLLGLCAGFGAVLGHCTCPWLGFRGGKGVATGLGAFIGWSWHVGALCCLFWMAGAIVTKRSSAASLLAFVAAPALFLILPDVRWREETAIAAVAVTLVMLLRHRTNIARLLDGTEPRIGAGK